MPLAPFDPITAIYTPAHAWMYETIVAPAVYRSRSVIDEYFLPHLPPNARVLDVGSGGALFTKYLADQRPDVHSFDGGGPQHEFRGRREVRRGLQGTALPRCRQPRDLPHLDRRALHQSRRGSGPGEPARARRRARSPHHRHAARDDFRSPACVNIAVRRPSWPAVTRYR